MSGCACGLGGTLAASTLLLSVLSVVTSYASTYDLLFFFNDTAPTEIYTLSLHDALPIYFFMAKTNMSCKELDIA